METHEKNVHEGHREKVRKRFMQENGFDHFEDHQILEMLLFYANSRSDTNPIAHRLLDTFGSLKGVLEARPEMLMTVPGVGESAAALISMVVVLTVLPAAFILLDRVICMTSAGFPKEKTSRNHYLTEQRSALS